VPSPRLPLQDKRPIQAAVTSYFKISHTGWRTAIWPGHTTWIQKADPTAHLIPRYVSVTVQEHIDVRRQLRRRDVHELKAAAAALEIHHERPLLFAVAVPAHHSYRRTNLPQALENVRCADIAQMPNFVGAFCELPRIRREVIVRISEDENSERFCHPVSVAARPVLARSASRRNGR